MKSYIVIIEVKNTQPVAIYENGAACFTTIHLVHLEGKVKIPIHGYYGDLCKLTYSSRMFLQTVIITVVLFATAMSLASEQCKSGSVNQHLCHKTCNISHCSCIMTDATPFTSCTQKCNFLSSCPEMVCSGKLQLDFQYFYFI